MPFLVNECISGDVEIIQPVRTSIGDASLTSVPTLQSNAIIVTNTESGVNTDQIIQNRLVDVRIRVEQPVSEQTVQTARESNDPIQVE